MFCTPQKTRGSRRQTFVKVLVVLSRDPNTTLEALFQELKQLVLSKSTAHRRERIKEKNNNPKQIKERGEMNFCTLSNGKKGTGITGKIRELSHGNKGTG